MATAFLLDSSVARPIRVETAPAAFAAAAAAPTAAFTAADLTVKPRLRGRLHQLCALASAPAGAHLVAVAQANQRLAAVAYATTWTAMFTASACYHRLAHSAVTQRRLRRADHSMIFAHMGGATTALSLSCLPAQLAAVLLIAVWSGIGAGIGIKVTRLAGVTTSAQRRSAGSSLYAVLPATVVLALPAFAATMSLAQLTLLVVSGAFYAVGGLLFFQRRPDPLPRVFGYHEVWHCFTVAGGLCQYALMHQLVG
jgi:hemolysin III